MNGGGNRDVGDCGVDTKNRKTGVSTRHSVSVIVGCLVVVLFVFASSALPAPITSVDADVLQDRPSNEATGNTETSADIAQGGPYFEANKGQVHPDVLFFSRASGYTLFLTATEAVFIIPTAGGPVPAGMIDSAQGPLREEDISTNQAPTHDVVRLAFVGANDDPHVNAQSRGSGESHYFIGDDPASWVTNVPHFQEVTLERVWPMIDLVFYVTEEGRHQYDFVVHEGGDAETIRIGVEGADMEIGPDGGMQLAGPASVIGQSAPFTYQVSGETRHEVESEFVLLDGGEIGIEVEPYDRDRRLVIDPVIVPYSTFLGGEGYDEVLDVAVGPRGSVYLTGRTGSTGFPVQEGFQPENAGGMSAFVSKFDKEGSLVFSTYFGGGEGESEWNLGWDQGWAIALDAGGHILVSGVTESPSLPVKNAFQDTYPGGDVSAFLAKFSPTGDSLEYSTYFGGGGWDQVFDLVIADGDEPVVTGVTSSENLPMVNARQPQRPAITSAFLARFEGDGSSPVFSTYYGGDGITWARGLTLGAGDDIILTGYTEATDLATQGTFQTENSQGPGSGFLTSFTPDGSDLLFATYLGGSNYDRPFDVAVGPEETIHVSGTTTSLDFPTRNAILPVYPGGARSAFVSAFRPDGTDIRWSTYLGGSDNDFAFAIAVDSAGGSYVAGDTQSVDFPVFEAYQVTPANDAAFVSAFGPEGSLVYSTFLGGTSLDSGGQALGIAGNGDVFVVGGTWSTDFPVVNGYQEAHPGAMAGYLTRLAYDPDAIFVPRACTSSVCVGPL